MCIRDRKKISGIPVCMAAIYARLSVDNDEDVYKRQDTVTADGVDKRAFYVEQQQKIADFANKVHAGEITNAAGEKFTTVVQDVYKRQMRLFFKEKEKVLEVG